MGSVRAPETDPYATLGVAGTASSDEIKKAYRKLVLEHHPDRNPGHIWAPDRFKEVQAAYELLSDSGKRAAYDALTAAREGTTRIGPRDGWRIVSDLFDDAETEPTAAQPAEESRERESSGDAQTPSAPPTVTIGDPDKQEELRRAFRDRRLKKRAVTWRRLAFICAGAFFTAEIFRFPVWGLVAFPLAALATQAVREFLWPYRIALAAVCAAYFAQITSVFTTPYSWEFRFTSTFACLSAVACVWGALTDSFF